MMNVGMMRVLIGLGSFSVNRITTDEFIIRSSVKSHLEKLSSSKICSDKKGYYIIVDERAIGIFSKLLLTKKYDGGRYGTRN